MAVSLYFGLPGCGKTTLLAALAFKAVKSGKYKNVYSNIPLKIFGVTYIKNECIGKYVLEDGLVLIDEATLYADSRDHKNFSNGQLTYFLEHRHFNVNIVLFTQQWDGVDRKIRVITDRVYYVYKGLFLGHWFTRYYRIPYGIIIPNAKKNEGQKLGEIIQGYCKPNLLIRLFSPWLFRPLYYPYFDSWDRPDGFDPLPVEYRPYCEFIDGEIVSNISQKRAMNARKRSILLRSKRFKTNTIKRVQLPSFVSVAESWLMLQISSNSASLTLYVSKTLYPQACRTSVTNLSLSALFVCLWLLSLISTTHFTLISLSQTIKSTCLAWIFHNNPL